MCAGANTGVGFEELHISILLFGVAYIVLLFFFVLYEHLGVELTFGVLTLTANRAPRAGPSVQDKLFVRFMMYTYVSCRCSLQKIYVVCMYGRLSNVKREEKELFSVKCQSIKNVMGMKNYFIPIP